MFFSNAKLLLGGNGSFEELFRYVELNAPLFREWTGSYSKFVDSKVFIYSPMMVIAHVPVSSLFLILFVTSLPMFTSTFSFI